MINLLNHDKITEESPPPEQSGFSYEFSRLYIRELDIRKYTNLENKLTRPQLYLGNQVPL